MYSKCLFCQSKASDYRTVGYPPPALRQAQTTVIFSSVRGDFEVFRPAEVTRYTDGSEIWCGGVNHPVGARVGLGVWWLKKTENFTTFCRFQNINFSHRRIPCTIFFRNFQGLWGALCLATFPRRPLLKFREIRLRGSRVLRVVGFKFEGVPLPPNFQRLLAAKPNHASDSRRF